MVSLSWSAGCPKKRMIAQKSKYFQREALRFGKSIYHILRLNETPFQRPIRPIVGNTSSLQR
jgi:hypothetical protein